MLDANEHFVDRYSIAHAALGAVAWASRVPPGWAIAAQIGFEAIENPLKDAMQELWPDARHDNWKNHVGDVASFTAGYYGAQALGGKPYGRAAITGWVALAAGIWAWSLLNPARRTTA